MTTARGSRLATSVGGTSTGRGGNLVIIDDPLKPQEAQSQSARDSLKQWYSNTLLQRLHPDDLVGHLLEHGGWRHLNLPAIAEEETASRLSPTRTFRVGPGIYAIGINPEGDKIMRMAGQTAAIEAGAVHLPAGAAWLGDFKKSFYFPLASTMIRSTPCLKRCSAHSPRVRR
jgi:hypothetical protein